METENLKDTGLRARLREETRSSHRRLDGLMEERPPLAKSENYAWYLNGMLHLYTECESSLQICEREIGLPARAEPLSNLIRRDLAALDVAAAINSRGENSKDQPLDSLSPSEHWGRAYVLEGSAMGGRMMARMAAERLGPPASHQFLKQLSDDAKMRWPLFVKAINQLDLDQASAIKSARSVFSLAYDFFHDTMHT